MASWWRPRGVHRGSTAGPGGGRRGAKTAGATPTTGCVTPPGGVGVERRREITPRRAPSLRFGGAPAERGENPPISARGTRTWSFRRDGATSRSMFRRRSTPTPPGGVTQPVVASIGTVWAARRGGSGTRILAADPRAGAPTWPRISAITLTTTNLCYNGYINTSPHCDEATRTVEFE